MLRVMVVRLCPRMNYAPLAASIATRFVSRTIFTVIQVVNDSSHHFTWSVEDVNCRYIPKLPNGYVIYYPSSHYVVALLL